MGRSFWEHRVVIVEDSSNESGIAYMLAEVYSTSKGELMGYCTPFTQTDSVEDMEKLLKKFHAALDKPILDTRKLEQRNRS